MLEPSCVDMVMHKCHAIPSEKMKTQFNSWCKQWKLEDVDDAFVGSNLILSACQTGASVDHPEIDRHMASQPTRLALMALPGAR